jgi:hypothetical protein
LYTDGTDTHSARAEFQTDAYASLAGPKIELELDLGVGGVTLRTLP